MDETTKRVRSFMASMHGVRESLGEIVRELYEREEVRFAHQYNPAPYLSFDLGVSAELKNGAGIDFWIEVTSTETGWDLHATVQRHDPDEDGSHIERDLGVRMVGSAETLPTEIALALRELRRSVGEDRLFR